MAFTSLLYTQVLPRRAAPSLTPFQAWHPQDRVSGLTASDGPRHVTILFAPVCAMYLRHKLYQGYSPYPKI